MYTILEKEIKNKRSNFLDSELDKFFIDKQKSDCKKRRWFKGCKYR